MVNDPLLDSIGDRVDDEIRELLMIAHQHDLVALDARRAAGTLLVRLRENLPQRELLHAIHQLGLDEGTVKILIGLAAGGRERAG